MIILFVFLSVFLELLYFTASPILFFFFRKKPDCERLLINYPKTRYDILVHAASVGEINGIRQLLKELLNADENLRIILTTNTTTGRETAKTIHDRLAVMLSPIDILHLRILQFMRSKPRLILIAETEIWPNLLFTANLFKTPVLFINARLSSKAFQTYYKYRNELNWLGKAIRAICAQTEADRERYSQIFKAECFRAGNLKFSVRLPEYDGVGIRIKWGYGENDKIIVMGSSRPGEEQLLIQCYYQLKEQYDNLRLVLAPRHLERLNNIQKTLENESVSYYSTHERVKDIHILDVMGQLLKAYAICDLAIIGGSFYPFGGHNPLEAAVYGKTIIMGPSYESCKGSVSKLLKADAIVISSHEKLYEDIEKVFSEPETYKSYGRRAKSVLEENKDSLPSHLELIRKYLD